MRYDKPDVEYELVPRQQSQSLSDDKPGSCPALVVSGSQRPGNKLGP
jgi:hypothetical protein